MTLETFPLGDGHALAIGRLPDGLAPDFEALWAVHPDDFHEITMGGRPVRTPRWQQAYGADYHYTGRVNRALPTPGLLQPLLAWAREAVDPRLNGLLLNWYDGAKGHYIGRHRDSIVGVVPETPIVTVSLGETRAFRMRPWRAPGFVDVEARDGSVIVIPWATNRAWTHEVPKAARYAGRRISVTLRAFEPAGGDNPG
ncbi:MAG: alpha-ketoglutarate-dependent dioxygenase AlkB [Alphaproteobacteria bacterium]|nr:alpha-ketoglutarate-dependent dioxygenase AlkB [Alphaproteobacteria bacterium]